MTIIKKLALKYLADIKKDQDSDTKDNRKAAVVVLERLLSQQFISDDAIISAFEEQIVKIRKSHQFGLLGEFGSNFIKQSKTFIQKAKALQKINSENGLVNNQLPKEILNSSFSYLDKKEQRNVRLVCKHWNRIMGNPFESHLNKIFRFWEEIRSSPFKSEEKVEKKILIIGQLGAGRTTLVQCLVNPEYRASALQLKKTFTSVDYIRLKNNFRFQLWDITSVERYGGAPIYKQLQNSDLFIMCIDGTEPNKKALSWQEEIWNYNDPEVPGLLVFTKLDSSNFKITDKLAQEYAEEMGAVAYFKCSGKTAEGVSEILEKIVEIFAPQLLISEEATKQLEDKPSASKCSIS